MGEAGCDSKYIYLHICDSSIFRKGLQKQKQPHCTNVTNILLTICFSYQSQSYIFPLEEAFSCLIKNKSKAKLYMTIWYILALSIMIF